MKSIESAHEEGQQPHVFAVLGDIHGRWKLALGALIRLERELDVRIEQLFCVGDLGLFLDEDDWAYLTGPKKHRHPEWSPEIREVWRIWRWPIAAIGGNHEPWHRLRVFDTEYFGERLTYTNAGLLAHRLDGLRVVGLSGIRGPDDSYYNKSTWSERLMAVHSGLHSRKLLAYYTESDVECTLNAGSADILLTHDWPVAPDHVVSGSPGEEAQVALERLAPVWHFCGHHHRAHQWRIGVTAMRALNIITHEDRGEDALPGWAWLGTWNGKRIKEIGYWPPLISKCEVVAT
jgi:lariat debranching enzyme